jgi:hypothetical protein
MSGDQVNSEDRAAQLEQELAATRAELDQERLTRQIESELRRAGATEAEAAAALVRERVREARGLGKDVDLRGVVAEIKKSKGVLFGAGVKPSGPLTSGATGAARSARASVQAATQAAEEARESGDRRALLRYLKLRRG